MMIMIYGNIHYTVIFAWITKFIVMSFSPVLPWTSCNHTWNTENCFDSTTFQVDNNFTQLNLSFESEVDMSGFEASFNRTPSRLVPASEEFLK